MTNVKLVSRTQVDENYNLDGLDLNNPESLMMYVARVSSSNQNNPRYARLLKTCLREGHWSVFEHNVLTFEFETSMPIAMQILRHKTACFQQLSRRYQEVTDSDRMVIHMRGEADKNRQSSIDNLSPELKQLSLDYQDEIWYHSFTRYKDLIDKGVARESARFLLPLFTKTRMFMTANLRTFIHFIGVRDKDNAQLECRDIVVGIKDILKVEFPVVAKVLEW